MLVPPEGHYLFPPFRLDPANERVWRDDELLPLRPKLFALLRHLVENTGRLVTRDEILKVVWPGTAVSEGVLRGCVRDLRDALQDDALTPRFIETVPRRGYRFIAPLSLGAAATQPVVAATPAPRHERARVVGRETELGRLLSLLDEARRGQRQVVFVTGEPGIGKTTLVGELLASLEREGNVWIGQGQCIEHYGAGEPYLPLLEALGRMGRRSTGGERLIAALRRYAPSWLAQMPAMLDGEEIQALRQGVETTTHERMLRELVETVEVLTTDTVMVLVLEDLHWVDHSTLDWLAAVAKQKGPARLLVVGTYRPADVSLRDHPLKGVKQELQAHRQCVELCLPFLSPEHVARYLAALGDGESTADLANAIHQRTDGNPLFVVNVVDYLLAQGVVAQLEGHWRLEGGLEAVDRCVPEGLRQLIEKQVERLADDDRALLEVASVAGAVFSAATVAGCTEMNTESVEERCEELARRGQFLREHDPELLSAGRMAGRYGFLHGLYQTVLYERLPATRRARLHHRIGEAEEARHGDRAAEVAAELAMHFERANLADRAAAYREAAAQGAMRSHAYHEAAAHLRGALDLLERLPETPEAALRKLSLEVALGAMLTMTMGYAAAEVERCYSRARAVCSDLTDPGLRVFPALLGLWIYRTARAEHDTAYALARELLHIAETEGDETSLSYAHMANGASMFWLGQLDASRASLAKVVEPDESATPHVDPLLRSSHPRVVAAACDAVALWLLGRTAEARERARALLRIAGELTHPHNLAFALFFSGWVLQSCGEDREVAVHAEQMMQLSAQYGFPIWEATGSVLQGWARARQKPDDAAIAAIERGIAGQEAIGAGVAQPYLHQVLVESCIMAEDPRKGLAVVNDALALVEKTGERVCEAELHRLKGELSLKLAPAKKTSLSEAEHCFGRAVEVAGRQGAVALELRAVTSLAKLLAQTGRGKEAKAIIDDTRRRLGREIDTASLVETPRPSRATPAGRLRTKR